jgi:hypothetical protein
LDGFESQTAQTSSQFFPIPSNPCVLGITEQALNLFSRWQDEEDFNSHPFDFSDSLKYMSNSGKELLLRFVTF